MAKNHYESVVILNAALEEEQVEHSIDHILETIKTNGGELTDVDKWGRRRLAYPIDKSKSGYYLVLRFIAPTELIAKLERNYNLDENVIRYLTITLDSKALKNIEKVKEEAANEAAEETAVEEVVEEKPAEKPETVVDETPAEETVESDDVEEEKKDSEESN